MVSRLVLAVLTTVILAACSSPTVKSPPPEPAPQAREEAVPQGGASDGLLREARQARTAGNYDKAEGFLLRAQRIDPRNGEVYLELARLYLATGDAEQAHSVAERGLLYCSGQTCRELREAL